eukprot:GHVT01063655.1.p1 GENE.GHVT01063655.1~~GHVT01063655.1.p1  ORF type:complete len:379 (+),score=52.11 GHVT01063655.1:901-2037(+)
MNRVISLSSECLVSSVASPEACASSQCKRRHSGPSLASEIVSDLLLASGASCSAREASSGSLGTDTAGSTAASTPRVPCDKAGLLHGDPAYVEATGRQPIPVSTGRPTTPIRRRRGSSLPLKSLQVCLSSHLLANTPAKPPRASDTAAEAVACQKCGCFSFLPVNSLESSGLSRLSPSASSFPPASTRCPQTEKLPCSSAFAPEPAVCSCPQQLAPPTPQLANWRIGRVLLPRATELSQEVFAEDCVKLCGKRKAGCRLALLTSSSYLTFLGFVSYRIHPETRAMEILKLAVPQSQQGKGYGKKLLKAVINLARQTPGICFIALSSLPEAEGFYNRLGFKSFPSIKPGSDGASGVAVDLVEGQVYMELSASRRGNKKR